MTLGSPAPRERYGSVLKPLHCLSLVSSRSKGPGGRTDPLASLQLFDGLVDSWLEDATSSYRLDDLAQSKES